MHSRNRYQAPHDFTALAKIVPALSNHFITTPDGRNSLDFAHPEAVRLLNQALLKRDYGLKHWDIPKGNLCPGVPGRLDYIHAIADLLAELGVERNSDGRRDKIPGTIIRNSDDRRDKIPGTQVQAEQQKKQAIIGLDVGTGASLIYPILGVKEYGWRFIATDIDATSLKVAGALTKFNPELTKEIILRKQPDRQAIFREVIFPDEYVDFTMCNPPFFTAPEEVEKAARKKWAKLGKGDSPTLNFGGQPNELWTPGGEPDFLRRMIRESVEFKKQVGWFTTLISKKGYLRIAEIELGKLKSATHTIINIGQGGKRRRILAWRF